MTDMVQIEMDRPDRLKVQQRAFSEAEMTWFIAVHAELETQSGGNLTREEIAEDYALVDGYVEFRSMAGPIRIGRGTIDGVKSWWVDRERYIRPTEGVGVNCWEYLCHFPGIYVPELLDWIYVQFIL